MIDKSQLAGSLAVRGNVDFFTNLWMALPNPNQLLVTMGPISVTFDNIRNDPHVYSCIQARKAGVKSLERELKSDKEVEKPVDEFVDHFFGKLKINKIIGEILNAPFFGYQPMEIMYEERYVGNMPYFIPVDIQAKPFEWFIYNAENTPKLLTLQDPIIGVDLPERKFIIPANEPSYAQPHGEAILSKLLWSVAFKKGGLSFWVQFLEKFGMPHFIGHTDQQSTYVDGTPNDDYLSFIGMLNKVIRDGSAVVGKDEAIELLANNATTQGAIYKDLIDYCNAEISKGILSNTLTTELTGNTGSFAASKTHADVKGSIADSDKFLVEDVINQMIRWAVDINFGEDKACPKFIMFPKEDVDKERADFTKTLADTKQITFTEGYWIDNFGFKPEWFKTVSAPSTPPSAPKPPANFAEHSDHAEAENKPSKAQLIIDAFGSKAVDAGVEIFGKITPIVTEYLDGKSDFAEASKGLALLLPDMDTSDLEKQLINLLFMSDVAGRLAVQSEIENG